MNRSKHLRFDESPRDERVREVLGKYIEQTAQGASISSQELFAQNPDLMPDLGDALRDVMMVQGELRCAGQSQRTGLHIRCPHCQSPIEIIDESPLSDISCPECGSQFSLTDDSHLTSEAGTEEYVNHFQLLDRVGAGAFGSVWRAYDTQLDRLVAIKVPRRGQLSSQEAELFVREARAAAQLRHPNIVRVLEVGRYKDRFYIASDLIDGVNLASWIASQRATPAEAAELCSTLAGALQHAHEHGVIHRDIKPSNVMLDTSGEPYLMDFGLAKREAGEITMTVSGKMLGTPAYMSPEQARGAAHSADGRSDIYSLGVLLFEMLTGERPFRGSTRMLLQQVLEEDAPRPSSFNSRVPRDLETICLKCLEKSSDQRYRSASDLRDDLQRFLRGEPVLARPVSKTARCVRWCRRKPLVTMLGASLAALLLFLSIAGPIAAISQLRLNKLQLVANQQAEKERVNARRAEGIALARAQTLSWQLYAMHLAKADQAILNRDYQVGQAELDACDGHRSWEWHFLKARMKSEIPLRISNLDAPVFTRDGKRLIVVGHGVDADAGRVQVWDLASKTVVSSFEHRHRSTLIALSPDEEYIVGGDHAGVVVVWDAQTGQELWSKPVHGGKVDGLAYSPNGQLIASAGWDKTVRLVDAANGDLRFSIGPFAALPRKVSFSPNGKWLAVGVIGELDVAVIIDTEKGEIVQRFPEEGRGTPTFSPDGQLVATASTDGFISLWDWDGEQLNRVRHWQALNPRDRLHMVKSLEFSHDGQHLVSGDQSSRCRVAVWNVATGEEVTELDAGDSVWWLATSPIADEVAFFTLSSGTRLWYYDKNDDKSTFPVSHMPIRHVALSPDGQRLLAVASNAGRQLGTDVDGQGTVFVIDVETGAKTASVDGTSAVWAADSTHFVTVRKEIHLYDAETGQVVRSFAADSDFVVPGVSRFGTVPDSETSPRPPQRIRLSSPEALRNETGSWLTRAQIGGATSAAAGVPKHGVKMALQVALSHDNRQVAIGYFADTSFVEIWDTMTQTLVEQVSLPDYLPVELEFNHTGAGLYVGGTGGTLSLFDTKTGKPSKEFNGQKGQVLAIANSPDGSRVVVGDNTGRVIVWHVESMQPLLTLTDSEVGVHSIDWSHDGDRIIAGKDDGSVQLWTLPTT